MNDFGFLILRGLGDLTLGEGNTCELKAPPRELANLALPSSVGYSSSLERLSSYRIYTEFVLHQHSTDNPNLPLHQSLLRLTRSRAVFGRNGSRWASAFRALRS